MNKKSLVMLIFACIFVTITAVLLFLDSLTSINTYILLFGPNPDLGDAIGGIFLFLYTILIAIGIGISAAATIPFLVALIKINGWKWYSIVILAFTALAVVSALVYVFMLPVVSNIENSIKNSSSSSMSSSALALF